MTSYVHRSAAAHASAWDAAGITSLGDLASKETDLVKKVCVPNKKQTKTHMHSLHAKFQAPIKWRSQFASVLAVFSAAPLLSPLHTTKKQHLWLPWRMCTCTSSGSATQCYLVLGNSICGCHDACAHARAVDKLHSAALC